MIKYEHLMKYFGKKLKAEYKTFCNKTLKAIANEAEEMPKRKGVSLKPLINVTNNIRARYHEGDDGDASITIHVGEDAIELVELTSYNHIRIAFMSLFIRDSEISTKIYNNFLPADWLVTYNYPHHFIGGNKITSFLEEQALLSFNSKNKLIVGYNLSVVDTSTKRKKAYKQLCEKLKNSFHRKLILLKPAVVSQKIRRINKLRKEAKSSVYDHMQTLVNNKVSFDGALTMIMLGKPHSMTMLALYPNLDLEQEWSKFLRNFEPHALTLMR